MQFVQPDSSSVVLNRVVGSSPTSILGSLTANGQVFLVNPNGVFFGKSASLDVQGLVASTLDIKDSDFMAGHYVFSKADGSAGASVVNAGAINANANGYVVLAGDYAENDGVITAQTGHVVLASGTHATLTLAGDSLLSFAVDQATLANLAGVSNTGIISADGGTVVMTADVANQLKATVVNNTGLVEAHSISAQGGSIYFTAAGGNIENSGTLDASATESGVAGGSVVLKGDAKTDLTSTSKIVAIGDNAQGGSLELSGHSLQVRGTNRVGTGGHILYDPSTVTINAGGGGGASTFGTGSIASHLSNGTNVTISASNSIVRGTGIFIQAPGGTSPGALKFQAGAGGIKLSGLGIEIKGNLT
ncbi:MAG: filamentous hemagglutinin N-terminal domain-containing protein, partial [bacterium]